MRLTLLWSQSTTGDYFEGESALSIWFHFGNGGQRQARVLDMLNWYTLNKKSRHERSAASVTGPKQRAAEVKTSLLKFETSDKYPTLFFFYYFKFGVHHCLTAVSWDGEEKKRKSLLFIHVNSTFFDKIKCCYQSNVLLAVWELITLSLKLYPCQLTGLQKMTYFLTVPCQWLCLSEIPSHVYSLPVWSLIILFLTNSSHPSLNLIGLWGSCKTKAANLSVFSQCMPWNISQVFVLCIPLSLKNMTVTFLGVLMSHNHAGLKCTQYEVWSALM